MAATPTNAVSAQDDFALVVGINDYPRLSEDRTPNDLSGPGPDALAVTNFLVNDIGVPCANVRCLISSGEGTCSVAEDRFERRYVPSKPRPTNSDIESCLETHIGAADDIVGGPQRLGRRLWIYLAGHGATPAANLGDLVLFSADARGATLPKHFHATAWANYLALLPPFDEIVLWMDCCSTIAFAFVPVTPPQRTLEFRAAPALRSFVMASGAGRQAFEAPDAQGVVRGIFTSRLLDGLRRDAGVDDDGWVTSKTLYNFLANDDMGLAFASRPDGRRVERQKPSSPVNDYLKLFHRGAATVVHRLSTGFAPGEMVEVRNGALAVDQTAQAGSDGSVSVALGTGLFMLEGLSSRRRYLYSTASRLLAHT